MLELSTTDIGNLTEHFEGMMVKDSTTLKLKCYFSSNWREVLIADSAGDFTIDGDFNVSADGGTSTTPRVSGFSNLSSGEYVRYQFGDSANGFQCGYGGTVDIFSWHTLRLVGDRAAVAPSWNFETAIGVHIPNTTASSPALVIDGAASQTGDLLQLRNSSGTDLAVFDSGGNLAIETTANPIFTLTETSGSTMKLRAGTTSSSLITVGSHDLYFGTNSTNWMKIDSSGGINMSGLPTTSTGLVTGDLWNNSGVVNIV